MCRAISRTSHPVQSVGVCHSCGVSDAASSANRVNSRSARMRASGRRMRSAVTFGAFTGYLLRVASETEASYSAASNMSAYPSASPSRAAAQFPA